MLFVHLLLDMLWSYTLFLFLMFAEFDLTLKTQQTSETEMILQNVLSVDNVLSNCGLKPWARGLNFQT
jgi:hypothetical protein